MFDDIFEKIKQIMASRLIPLSIVLVVLFSVLINRLFQIQIIEGQENADVSSLQETRTTTITPSRGLIRASNGEILADNKLVYTVELYDLISNNKEKNEMLSYLIKTLKEFDNEIDVKLPISYDNGKFEFTVSGNALKTFKTNAFAQGKLKEEHEAATAEEVFNYMREKRFYVDEKYSIEEAIEIIGLRYAMYIMWPPQNPVVVSSDVSEETVVAIKERAPKLQGVNIGKQSKRYYVDNNEPFAHILGYTGLINESELENFQKDNIDKYDSFDVIGKAGVEKSFEDILSGEKGLINFAVDGLGRPTEVLDSTDPIAGSDIYLSIDPDLQRAVYQLIEQNLSGILLDKINNSKDAGTKGYSSSNIRIPIYDVYFAFINNEIIDTNHFKADDATSLEKQVYLKFQSKLSSVLADLERVLAKDSKRTSKELSDETNEYLAYVNSLLSKHQILYKEKVNKDDDIYKSYIADDISLSEYLQYAITNNWINLDKLAIDNEYFDTNELYQKLLDYLKDILVDDKDFHKLIYYYLIDSYKLSGTEISLLLFDQGVLEYNEEEVSKLQNGSISSYTFITNKIRSLEITPAQLALEPFSASVVVTDVKTGKIKAIVSYPSYDSNNYADFLKYELTSPLYSRAIREAIAPGSTYKMVSAIAGLEEGVITPHEKIRDEYIFTKAPDTRPPKCHVNNHGLVNVVEALEVSCNYFFYEVAYRLSSRSSDYNDKIGLDKLAEYASMLGLGQEGTTNIEKEVATTSYTAVSDSDPIRSSIGQGTNVFTPVNLATYVTTLASSGKLFDLTLIDKIQDGDRYVENKADFTQLDQIKDSTWSYVQEGMYLVGNGEKGSTSRLFKDLREAGIEVAGKTGTAQVSKSNANHALFVSYGPYENPEISVTVVIPNGYTSGNAAALAKDIYTYYFNVSDEGDLLTGEAQDPEANTPAFSD